ncbi:hypothetical protein [Rhizobium sp. L1K21]|uniref:hypothetical protein n=1 Tax=Rhizobium sp. L1K21 TaxID=2954933 RepID=UPI002092AF17|nr:hypothetical protein [Rhizobium sp. L1K21]MCO6187848.1 hypothetical protein [Rhizobium sp. L1K21]
MFDRENDLARTECPMTHLKSVVRPSDLAIMQHVYNSVSNEPWFTQNPVEREKFARYTMRLYERGLVVPQLLEIVCRISAQRRFLDGVEYPASLHHTLVMVVEEGDAITSDASDSLAHFGATVFGPVKSVKQAVGVIAQSDKQFDAVLIDMAFGKEEENLLFECLHEKQIPYAVSTDGEPHSMTSFRKPASTFSQPADWAAIASQLMGGKL